MSCQDIQRKFYQTRFFVLCLYLRICFFSVFFIWIRLLPQFPAVQPDRLLVWIILELKSLNNALKIIDFFHLNDVPFCFFRIRRNLNQGILTLWVPMSCILDITLCVLGSVNYQKSRWKVRIHVDKKKRFLKEAWHLKG